LEGFSWYNPQHFQIVLIRIRSGPLEQARQAGEESIKDIFSMTFISVLMRFPLLSMLWLVPALAMMEAGDESSSVALLATLGVVGIIAATIAETMVAEIGTGKFVSSK
jgi:hypothetical protein